MTQGKKLVLAASAVVVSLVAAGVGAVSAFADDNDSPLSITGRVESGCGVVTVAYDAPDDALVELYQSTDGGVSWERMPREPVVRTVRGVEDTIRFRATLGSHTVETETLKVYDCFDPEASPAPLDEIDPTQGARTPRPSRSGERPALSSSGGLAKTGVGCA